jgi:hypothetical protein
MKKSIFFIVFLGVLRITRGLNVVFLMARMDRIEQNSVSQITATFEGVNQKSFNLGGVCTA